jgi:hypothetical protein
MKRIYLDDIRTPKPETGDWVVVKNYDEFVKVVTEIGLENISLISLDHDLGDSAMHEWHTNVYHNYTLDYNNIHEKTGYDCAKWLVEHYYDNYVTQESRSEKKQSGIIFPRVYTHSANPIGSANIMGYLNNFFMNEGRPQTCTRVNIPHTVEKI